MKSEALAERVKRLEAALRKIEAFKDGGANIGMSNTCGTLNAIARRALNPERERGSDG